MLENVLYEGRNLTRNRDGNRFRIPSILVGYRCNDFSLKIFPKYRSIRHGAVSTLDLFS